MVWTVDVFFSTERINLTVPPYFYTLNYFFIHNSIYTLYTHASCCTAVSFLLQIVQNNKCFHSYLLLPEMSFKIQSDLVSERQKVFGLTLCLRWQ